MSWHDFFYFSKGERRGLIVLLCLVTIAGILLIRNQQLIVEKKDTAQDHANSQTAVDKSTHVNSPDTRIIPSETSSKDKQQTVIYSDLSSGDESLPGQSQQVDTENNKTISDPKDVKSSRNASVSDDVSEQSDHKETVPERVKRLTSYSRPSYPRTEKLKEGTVVELNTADTTLLKKIPGIGSTFAKRIVNYRNLLGGYYSVTQLSEVYGIDEDRYAVLASWFSADPSLVGKLPVNKLPQDSLRRHPYINYKQAQVITQLRRQKGKLVGWENLQLLDEFTDGDKMRLQHYLSFE